MARIEPTGLQVWLAVVFDAFGDARDELDDVAYAMFVSVVCDRIGLEAGRLLLGDLLREERRHQQDAA